jgi:phosphohistidine phosphatase
VALIAELPEALDCVLVVGHNPTLTELAGMLCPEARIDNLPTCGVLHLSYRKTTWRALVDSKPDRWDFDCPKRLPTRRKP